MYFHEKDGTKGFCKHTLTCVSVKNALFLYLIEDFFELHIYSQIKLLSLHQTLINLHGEPK